MKQKNKLYAVDEISDFKELIDYAVGHYENKIAFKYKKDYLSKNPEYVEVTYAGYKKDICSLATSLIDLGLEGKKVAIIGPNRYEWCTSYFAITTSNMTIVPLDKSLPDNEIESSIIRSKVECVIFDIKYIEIFEKLRIEKSSNLKYFVCMDKLENNTGVIQYKDLMIKGEKLINQTDTRYRNVKIDKDKITIMLFTSGTTSTSKVVMLSQYNICSNINAFRSIIKIKQEDTLLSFLPLHHTLECSTTFLMGISCGATIAFCDGLKYIAKNLAEYKVTAFVCVPLMLETMYKKVLKGIEDSGKADLVRIMTKISKILLKVGIDIRKKVFKSVLDKMGGHLRLLVSGAAAIDKETIEGFNNFGIELIQGYGLTESSPVLCVESDKYKRPGSVGFPLHNIELKINNPDQNGIGEIIAKGPNIMSGYFENEQATKEVLRNGWFYTGDLGYIDKDGYVYVKGRIKTVIVLKNGKNIYPEEIESEINKFPFVAECMIYEKEVKEDIDLACKIVYNKEVLEEIFNIKTVEEYKKTIWEEIKKLNKTMPPYKYIREIIITEEPLIKTTTQKIKRHEEMKKIKCA